MTYGVRGLHGAPLSYNSSDDGLHIRGILQELNANGIYRSFIMFNDILLADIDEKVDCLSEKAQPTYDNAISFDDACEEVTTREETGDADWNEEDQDDEGWGDPGWDDEDWGDEL